MSDSEIGDLINFLPHASFKDATTGKYILVSEGLAVRCHLESPSQMIGLTVEDLGFGITQCGKEFEQKTKEMDAWVRANRNGIKLVHAGMRFGDENLIYQTISKLPIVGERKLLGVITFGEDMTPNLPRQSLYLFYKYLCGSKDVAIKKFLQHLEIDAWFFTLPTEAETFILLERGAGKSIKEIAIERQVSARTIHAQINSIRGRLKGDVLPRILERLRISNRFPQGDIK